MTTPNALILAKFKDDATYEAKILSLFKDCPHITLENKGKIEMDVFKDYALKIRLHIFEAADRSFFRKRHSAVKSIRIMSDSIVDECFQKQHDFITAHFIDKIDAYSSPLEEYNRAVFEMCANVTEALTGSGGIAIFCLLVNTQYHLFLAGTEAALASGTLDDVIPTVLDLMGIAKPDEMKGTSLII